MNVEERKKEVLKLLKEEDFMVSFDHNKQLLFIEKNDMSIHCVKKLIKVSKDCDSESFDISDKDFSMKYKTARDKKCLKFAFGGRYVYFEINRYVNNISRCKDVILGIDFLVSLHINSYFDFEASLQGKKYQRQL